MRYSYEYKRKCVELYQQGKRPETPEGVFEEVFIRIIRKWVRIEAVNGSIALRHKGHNKVWTGEEKFELVAKVFSGK